MKVLKYTALFFCFVLIAGGAFFGVFHVLNSRDNTSEQSSPEGTKADTKTDKPAGDKNNTDPSPTPASSFTIKEADRVNVQTVESVTISALAESALKSVVQINADVRTTDAWGRSQRGTSQGSGIILDKDDEALYIATNHHVIEGAEKITVTFPDGTEKAAVLRGSDAAGDLAILTIAADDLTDISSDSYAVASVNPESVVEVGDMVVALGNALGYGTSVTVGYVSATDREVATEEGELLLIQTDAAINPGNSGGALINLDGEVIGINSMKYSESFSRIEGMGFAIPISQALPILNELKQQKSFPAEEAGYLGVYITSVTSDMAQTFGWPKGVYVNTVTEGGAAAKAGILPGDIILSVNGIRVLNTSQLSARVTAYRAGSEITLVVSRENGDSRTELSIPVTLMEKESIPE